MRAKCYMSARTKQKSCIFLYSLSISHNGLYRQSKIVVRKKMFIKKLSSSILNVCAYVSVQHCQMMRSYIYHTHSEYDCQMEENKCQIKVNTQISRQCWIDMVPFEQMLQKKTNTTNKQINTYVQIRCWKEISRFLMPNQYVS